MKPTIVTDRAVEFDMEDWFFAVRVVETGDKNGDGLGDLIVEVEDRAKKGSYATAQKLLLTRFTATGDLVALAYEP
jgi:hypothetical protein